jgi:phospholipid/cholesterol/gamma-HCH transport system substrate-binding protein
MSGNVVETLIGAVVLVVAGFFLYFSYDKADVGMVEGYSLTAKFDKVDGVKVGSDVMLAGIKVGTVTDESLDTKEYLAVLQLSLASDVQLPDDSVIKIASDGLLGGKYLSIDPGGSEDYLDTGDEIRFTKGDVDLTELIGKALYSGGGKPTQ